MVSVKTIHLFLLLGKEHKKGMQGTEYLTEERDTSMAIQNGFTQN
jgi:hypothetical protein